MKARLKQKIDLILNSFDSRDYWEKRYQSGGNSGEGSYRELSKFKAEIINDFVEENDIERILEFGCGDGNQLRQFDVKNYIGLDVSPTVIEKNIDQFKEDSNKSFFLYESHCFSDNHDIFSSRLVISLDVLFHLVEDNVYYSY